MATTDAEPKLCTRCGKKPKAGNAKDTNPWCQECRTEYQRERNAAIEWRAERRGIVRGIRAMREHLAVYFKQWNARPFLGAEIASIIDGDAGPPVADEALPPRN